MQSKAFGALIIAMCAGVVVGIIAAVKASSSYGDGAVTAMAVAGGAFSWAGICVVASLVVVAVDHSLARLHPDSSTPAG